MLGALPDWLTGPVIVEYRNSQLDHYFLTASGEEMAAIDAGRAGPGWSRTGFTIGGSDPSCLFCPTVVRFRGIEGVGPNSHFFTAHQSEIESLEQPGSRWAREGVAFLVPRLDGCTAPYVPVYRLQNGRGAVNDTNHRYVTSLAERDAMLARGWLAEGIAFCATQEQRTPLQSYEGHFDLAGRVRPAAECENPSINLGGCLAVNNLPVPNQRVQQGPNGYALFDSSAPGSLTDRPYVRTWDATESARARFGINIDTAFRGPSPYSSVGPLYQLPTAGAPGTVDGPFFPWRPSSAGGETELLVTASAAPTSLVVRGSGSHLYGHPTLNFRDQRSGRRVHFNVLAYGTMDGADFVAPDAAGRKVIVGTTFRTSPWMRNLGSATLKPTLLGLRLHTTIGSPFYEGRFALLMNRLEFQNVLDAARGADPALSPDPGDYLLENFSFKNEVFGDGTIFVTLSDFALHVMRR